MNGPGENSTVENVVNLFFVRNGVKFIKDSLVMFSIQSETRMEPVQHFQYDGNTQPVH